MDKTKKVRKVQERSKYPESLRRAMIDEYLLGHMRKQEVWKKYTGEAVEHGKLLEWMRELGYDTKKVVFSPFKIPLPMEEPMPEPVTTEPITEISLLLERIKFLEKALKMSELKQEGYNLMIDLAEKQFKIPIRKK